MERLFGRDSTGQTKSKHIRCAKTKVQGLVDTVAAEFTPTSQRIRAFVFTTPFTIEAIVGAAPNTPESPRFIELAAMLLRMFDLPLWALIIAVACACLLALLCANVSE